MPITDKQKERLNKSSPTARDAKLGDELQAIGNRVAAVQSASTASDVAGLVTDFNALLTKLKAAGLMASS